MSSRDRCERTCDESPLMSPQVQYRLMLHIQMQLCELSLWDWIAERDGRARQSVDEAACEYRGRVLGPGREWQAGRLLPLDA